MSDKYTTLTPELYAYMIEHRSERDPVLARLAQHNDSLGMMGLAQIAPEQGAFITLLTRAIGARHAVEVGTFTGYSALCLARGLAPEGRLLCCDIDEVHTAVARRHWQEAGLADKIELRIGPALDTLRALPETEQFDIGFIDADKTGYRGYYEEVLKRLRPNGLILFDNVLYQWSGQITRADATDENTVALRALNGFLAQDQRIEVVMLSVGDGLTIARKRTDGESRP